jgi:hypothetical protein
MTVNMDIQPQVEGFFDEASSTISYIAKDPNSDPARLSTTCGW